MDETGGDLGNYAYAADLKNVDQGMLDLLTIELMATEVIPKFC